jgi:hypothetical protein
VSNDDDPANFEEAPMIPRLILFVAAIALVASAANAQVADPSPRSGLLFGPMGGPASGQAKDSVAATIDYIHKLEADARARQAAPAGQKECPMPVHRVDTTQLEKMRVARPSPTIVYSMPASDPHCPNPLDRAK